ncbi:MAG TPA: hypothetical protein VM597_02225 [Gemmataceae bacterium]|jgi:hypothetical protein|nr:hypothetical protein [Gemmataceae bacterium]
MSYITDDPLRAMTAVIAVFLAVTVFRIAWREDWGWWWGLVLAAIIGGLAFVWWPWGLLGAGAIVGKLYQSYG